MPQDPTRKTAVLYPVRTELRYQTDDRTPCIGAGKSVAISSREVVFQSDRPLKRGTRVQLSLAWPALLNHRVPLQLVVSGEVVWSQGSTLSVAIWKYQFRTRGLPANAKPALEKAQTPRSTPTEIGLRPGYAGNSSAPFDLVGKNNQVPRQDAIPVSIIS